MRDGKGLILGLLWDTISVMPLAGKKLCIVDNIETADPMARMAQIKYKSGLVAIHRDIPGLEMLVGTYDAAAVHLVYGLAERENN